MKHLVRILIAAAGIAVLAIPAQTEEKAAPRKLKRAWTLHEARKEWALDPHNSYLQYVVMQLARRENRLAEFADQIEESVDGDRRERSERRSGIDLFSIFSGALAVQESLQLDTMRGERRRRNPQPEAEPRPSKAPEAPEGFEELAPPPERVKPAEEKKPEKPTSTPLPTIPVDPLFTIKTVPVEQVRTRKIPLTVTSMVQETVKKDGAEFVVNKPVTETVYKELRSTVTTSVSVVVPHPPLVSFSAAMLAASAPGPVLSSTTLGAFATDYELQPQHLFTVKWTTVPTTIREDVTYTVMKKVPKTTTVDGVTKTEWEVIPETAVRPVDHTINRVVKVASPHFPLASFSATMMSVSAPGPILTGTTLAAHDVKSPPEAPSLDKLAGPAIKSHPWKKMLAGRKPEISPLALCVPDDFYFAEFRSLNKLLETLEGGKLWSTHVYTQAVREGRTQRAAERLQEQLAVQHNALVRRFLDHVVGEVAVTGSDLYLREGSDVTLIFQLKEPKIFRARMDAFLKQAQQKYPRAKTREGEYLGISYVHVGTSEREVNVFSAYPRPDLHVRSNSLPALQRVLQAIVGKDEAGKKVRRLGETDEFAYIRTLMPRGAKEEDGFIYLSDPFIRRQVGPRVKLTEQRRLRCYNHLRMIGHGSMMYRTEYGAAPESLERLLKAECAPGLFGAGDLACPDGGTYTLTADGNFGACSHHGHAHFLKPCCETVPATVTREEVEDYADFLREYNQYWRTYFDPIAIRVQAGPERYRLETIVLPLIDNSIYSGLSRVIGGKPEPLDALPVPRGNIFSINFRFNKDALLKELEKTYAPTPGVVEKLEGDFLTREINRLGVPKNQARKLTYANFKKFLNEGLGNQIGLHVYDAEPHVDFNLARFGGGMMATLSGGRETDMLIGFGLFMLSSANSPGYFAIPVQDEAIVDDFIGALDAVSAALARRDNRDFDFIGAGIKTDFYRIAHPSKIVIRGNGIQFGATTWRFFAARVGKVYYIATKQAIIEDLIAAHAKPATGDPGAAAHAMIRVRPENWKKTLPDYRLGWAENHRQACLCNLPTLSHVGRAFGSMDNRSAYEAADAERRGLEIVRIAERQHAVRYVCPDGGSYLLDQEGRNVTCSRHGSILQPRQSALEPMEPGEVLKDLGGMTVTFSLLEDGLRAVLTIDRKKP